MVGAGFAPFYDFMFEYCTQIGEHRSGVAITHGICGLLCGLDDTSWDVEDPAVATAVLVDDLIAVLVSLSLLCGESTMYHRSLPSWTIC